MKKYWFRSFFNPKKSPNAFSNRNKKGVIVWNSNKKGTYVKKFHGVLKVK